MGLFGIFSQKKETNDVKEYLAKGAVVLDVRTLEEWDEAHGKQAKHIVLTTVPLHLEEIRSWDKPIIAVCRSGARSSQATQFLVSNGLDAINGGPWQNVDQYVIE
jgi:rhodanese-related sulfurtransferase